MGIILYTFIIDNYGIKGTRKIYFKFSFMVRECLHTLETFPMCTKTKREKKLLPRASSVTRQVFFIKAVWYLCGFSTNIIKCSWRNNIYDVKWICVCSSELYNIRKEFCSFLFIGFSRSFSWSISVNTM